MPKVLSKSGDSLADVYDVEGSIAGVEELLSKDINLVHEMGATIFSERLSTRMVDLTSGAIAQTLAFNVNFTVTETARLLGIQVITSDPARLLRVQASITSPPAVDNQDVPIWLWDVAANGVTAARLLLAGTVTAVNLLNPNFRPDIPNLLVGLGSPRPASTISLRGFTATFGAGTVTTQALILLAFPQVGGLSSRGLPIPSW